MADIEIKHVRNDGTFWIEGYDRTEYYCPNCGSRGLFIECGGGDYYLGSRGVCLSCYKSHHNAGDYYNVEEKLKSALQNSKQ
jgi:hypothetical protein